MVLKDNKFIFGLFIVSLLSIVGVDCANADTKLNEGIVNGLGDGINYLLDDAGQNKFISITNTDVNETHLYLYNGDNDKTVSNNILNFESNKYDKETNMKISSRNIILNRETSNVFNNNYLTFSISGDRQIDIENSIFKITDSNTNTNGIYENAIVLTQAIASIKNTTFDLGSGVESASGRKKSNSIYFQHTSEIGSGNGNISNGGNTINLGGNFNKVIYYGENNLLKGSMFTADKTKNHSIIIASSDNVYVTNLESNIKKVVGFNGEGRVLTTNKETAKLTIKEAISLSQFDDFRIQNGATLIYDGDFLTKNGSNVLLTVNKFTIIDKNDDDSNGTITVTGFGDIGELGNGERINILKVDVDGSKLRKTMFNVDYDRDVNKLEIDNTNGYVYLTRLAEDENPDDPFVPDPANPGTVVDLLTDNDFGEYITNTIDSLPYAGEEPTDILANAFIHYDDMIDNDPNNGQEYANKAEDIVRTATPDQTGVLYRVAENNFKIVKNAVDSRIRDIIYAFDNKYTSYINAHWVDIAYSNQNRRNGKDARKNYDVETVSLTLGKDYFLTRYYVLGAIYNFDFSKIKTNYREIDQMSYNLSFYMKYNLTKNFYTTFINGVFYNEYKEKTAQMADIRKADGTIIPLSTVFASPKHHSEQYSAVLSLNFNTTYLLFTVFANYNFISFDKYDDKAGQEIETRNVRTTRVGGEIILKNIGRIDTKHISVAPEFFISANTLVGDNRKEFRITNKKSRKVSRIKDVEYSKDEETELKVGTRVKVNISHMSVDFGYNYTTDLAGDYKAHNFNVNFNYIY